MKCCGSMLGFWAGWNRSTSPGRLTARDHSGLMAERPSHVPPGARRRGSRVRGRAGRARSADHGCRWSNSTTPSAQHVDGGRLEFPHSSGHRSACGEQAAKGCGRRLNLGQLRRSRSRPWCGPWTLSAWAVTLVRSLIRTGVRRSIGVKQWAEICRLVLVEKVSQREVARRLGIRGTRRCGR